MQLEVKDSQGLQGSTLVIYDVKESGWRGGVKGYVVVGLMIMGIGVE